MISKTVSAVLLAGILGLNARADFDPFNDPAGAVNVFNSNDVYVFTIAPFGLADLQAITTNNITFELIPNVNLYADNPGDSFWRNNGGAGPDGNAILEANTVLELPDIPADLDVVTFDFNVDAFDLDTGRYSMEGFIRVLDPNNGYNKSSWTEFPIFGTGFVPLTLSVGGLEGQLLQVGWEIRGLNANPADDWGSATVTISNLNVTSIDFDAPTPNPMLFAFPPTPVSDSAISMTASNATDNFSGVEYLFTNITEQYSSGWQSSPTWVDDGPSGGVTTAQLALVNADFDAAAGWTYESNVGWGDPSDASWTNDAGNGVGYAYVNGSEDNGNGGYAVIFQAVSLSGTDFSEGDLVTLSADVKALAGLNGGGALLKMESWGGGAKISDSGDVFLSTTESWDNYSMNYTIASGADEVRAVLGTSTGWGGQNANDSHYLFDNVSVSGVVDVPAGLSPETEYTYQVKARDTGVNQNQTFWSDPASATTFAADNDAPLPATMSFAAVDSSPITVKLTATTATDVSGVEYYFDSTSAGGNDSGWQSSPIYYDTGLEPGMTYSYTVIARDISFAKNSNTVSAVTNVTTPTTEAGAFDNALTGTGNTDDPEVLFQWEKTGLTTGSENAAATIDFSASGATFGDGLGAAGRNLLKTIASDYQDVSIEAYATLTFSGATDLSGFIGMGQGLQTGVPDNFGVPELNLEGVNGVVGQFKDSTDADTSSPPDSNLFKFVGGNPDPSAGGTNISSAVVGSTETIRARLIYDAKEQTVNVAFDKNYTGGAFVADQDMGTVDTTLTDTNAVTFSMWDGAPVRIYVGGGEGTIVKDFKIVVTREAQPPFDIQIADVAGSAGVALAWEGTSGYTYDVQYTTNLVDGPWMTDPSPGASDIFSDGGAVSATSTVDGVSIFYRVFAE